VQTAAGLRLERRRLYSGLSLISTNCVLVTCQSLSSFGDNTLVASLLGGTEYRKEDGPH